ncbi:MAG: hypothetical protein JNK58_08630 [Phycisphaerae bacterium]|nr:hypothetical protein [Phycisphaerae bacterium]
MRSACLIVVGGSVLAGCSLPQQRADFDSTDPAERVLAVGVATEKPSRESVPALIRLLESDDPAERMLAIRSLEKQTGRTFGYEYADSEARRAEAVRRWVAWERGGGAGSSGGVSAPIGQ